MIAALVDSLFKGKTSADVRQRLERARADLAVAEQELAAATRSADEEAGAAYLQGRKAPDSSPVHRAAESTRAMASVIAGLEAKLAAVEAAERAEAIAKAQANLDAAQNARRAEMAVVYGCALALGRLIRSRGFALLIPNVGPALDADMAVPHGEATECIRAANELSSLGVDCNPIVAAAVGEPDADLVRKHAVAVERLLSKLAAVDFSEVRTQAQAERTAKAQAEADAAAAAKVARELQEAREIRWMNALLERRAITSTDEFLAASTVLIKRRNAGQDVPTELGQLITAYYLQRRNHGIDLGQRIDMEALEREMVRFESATASAPAA